LVSLHRIEHSGKTHGPSIFLYIKKMGMDTVYRVEERKHPHKPALDFINDIFNPMEKVETQIAALNTKISAVYDIVSKPRDGNSIRY
jgi:hypothetical protein